MIPEIASLHAFGYSGFELLVILVGVVVGALIVAKFVSFLR